MMSVKFLHLFVWICFFLSFFLFAFSCCVCFLLINFMNVKVLVHLKLEAKLFSHIVFSTTDFFSQSFSILLSSTVKMLYLVLRKAHKMFTFKIEAIKMKLNCHVAILNLMKIYRHLKEDWRKPNVLYSRIESNGLKVSTRFIVLEEFLQLQLNYFIENIFHIQTIAYKLIYRNWEELRA